MEKNKIKIVSIPILGVLLCLLSCGSQVLISSQTCYPYKNIKMTDIQNFVNDDRNEAKYFSYTTRKHSFLGDTDERKKTINLCPHLEEYLNSSLEDTKVFSIKTEFTLLDVLIGLMPGYDPRTVNIKGLVSRKDNTPVK